MSFTITSLLFSSLLPVALAKGKGGGGRKGGGRVTTVYVGGGGNGHGASKTTIIIVSSIIGALVLFLLLYVALHYYRQHARSKPAKINPLLSYSQVSDVEANRPKSSESKPAKSFFNRFNNPFKKNKKDVPSVVVTPGNNDDEAEKATLVSPSSVKFPDATEHYHHHQKYDDPYEQNGLWKISSANTSYSNLSSPTQVHIPLPPYSPDDDKKPMLSPPRSPSPYERSDDKTPTMPMPSHNHNF